LRADATDSVLATESIRKAYYQERDAARSAIARLDTIRATLNQAQAVIEPTGDPAVFSRGAIEAEASKLKTAADLLGKGVSSIPEGEKDSFSNIVQLANTAQEQLNKAGDAASSMSQADSIASLSRQLETAGFAIGEAKDILEATSIDTLNNITESINISLPVSRTGTRINSVGPTDVNQVFIPENLLDLAISAQVALGMGRNPNSSASTNEARIRPLETWKVRLTDVRSFLRHELEAAYDILDTATIESMPLLMDVPYVESILDLVTARRFEATKDAEPNSFAELNELAIAYEAFTHRLPGNLRRRPLGALAWAIVVEGGLLNRQLRQDMLETKGDGYVAPADVEGFYFYTPTAAPDAEFAFQEYIKARWPMITFALEPVTDQQNIEDAFTRRRDLQLAVAFALSSGRISFRQAIQFTRQLQYEAQTIALNQTVTAFAHANDTFGWRFSPRYQTPPEENNFQAIGNLLGRGGPGPNYQIKNSKIEPGLRELTAVVVMPSFVRGVRFDVSTDWYKLHDPDERKVNTVHTINLGHRINEARQALAQAESCGMHRPEDVQRLAVRLTQLERMLPMQTSHVKVPYENTLGGFALFTQGVTALVPETTGFEGIEYLERGEGNTAKGADLLIYGKHFSIYEMEIVAGGKTLLREGAGTTVMKEQEKTMIVGATISPLRKPDGKIVVFDKDGAAQEVSDVGTYNIVSREVLRVHLPDDMATAFREDGQEIVEFYVSTPNGISNRLQIPVRPAPVVVRPAFSTPAQGQSYLLPTDRLTIPINAHIETAGSEPIAHGVGEIPFDQTLTFKPTLTSDPMPPAINARFVFVGTANTLLPPIDLTSIPFDEGTGLYVMGASHIEELATSLFKQVIDNNLAIAPTTTAQTSRIAVAPQPGNTAFGTLNQLTVGFEFTLAVPPATTANPPAESAMLRASFNQPSFATAPTPEAAASSILPPLPTPGRLSPASPGGQAPVVLPAAFRPVQDTTTPAAPQGGQVAAPTATAPQAAAVPGPQPAPAAQPFPQGFADAAALLSRAAASQPPTVMVLPQRAPIVNVEVPITNESPKRHGLFHREPISPSNPARRPILERLRGQF
jgi:hypothetical protein